jgi:SAM-dependent methyltransferase
MLTATAKGFNFYEYSLSFGPDVRLIQEECPVDASEFRMFEKVMLPYVEVRDKVYAALPGGKKWRSFIPSRPKILEYYLTTKALRPRAGMVYVDLASYMSLYPNYLAEQHGVVAIRQDMLYTPGKRTVAFRSVLKPGQKVQMQCLGGNAIKLDMPDASADAMALQCSIEHFEGRSDTDAIVEAWRVLKPGGRLLIIPFYCGDKYEEIMVKDCPPGCQFRRHYDPYQFRRRVLEHIPTDFELEMRYYRNVKEIDPQFCCVYSVALRKP